MNKKWLQAALFSTAVACLLLVGGHESDTIASRRQRVAQMTPDEKAELARLWERFQALSSEEQEKLRVLEREIGGDYRAAELRDVMRRYYQWSVTLPAYQRLELLELPAKERVKHIAAIKRDAEDAEGLKKWLDEKAEVILAEMPEKQRQQLAALGSSGKHMILFRLVMTMSKSPDGEKRITLTDQDLVDLRSHLSEQTRQVLANKTPAQQWDIIGERLRRHVRAEMAARRFGHQRRGGPFQDVKSSGIAAEELARLFESLPEKQQDALLSLPAEDMQEQLQQLFMDRSFPRNDRFDDRNRNRPRFPKM